MALLPVSKAAELVGLSRKTMYSHIKTGKVSANRDNKGSLLIDTSELIRVFGALRQEKDSVGNTGRQPELPDVPTGSQENTPEYVTKILAEMSQMRSEIERLSEKVEELQMQLALPAPKEEKKGCMHWLFGKIEN